MLTRFPDWQARLDRFFTANCARKFRYGAWDCCLFAADAVAAMTAVDLAQPYRGRYDSRATAAQLMREVCGAASVEQMIAAAAVRYGLSYVAEPRAAFRGDIVLVARRKGREHSLGILDLSGRSVVIPFAAGLRRIGMEHAVAAWRI